MQRSMARETARKAPDGLTEHLAPREHTERTQTDEVQRPVEGFTFLDDGLFDDFEVRLDFTEETKWKDKLTFFFGVANVIATAYLVGGAPRALPIFYSVKFVLLIIIRYFRFRARKHHSFLLDFCYFGNALILVYLWIFPHVPRLFEVCFGIAMGPLGWAVPTFRNSLVFHSVDRLTSLLIHLTPGIVMFVLRFRDHDSKYKICDGECEASFVWLVFVPLAYFMAHQILHIIITRILPTKIKRDKSYMTTYRYLTRNRSGPVSRALNIFGPSMRVPLWVVYFGLFSGVSMLPNVFWFEYEYACFAFLALIATIAAWHGAVYYVEAFAKEQKKRYETR